MDRRLFGAFVEHLGRCVYGGIYEPEHPAADSDGFRQDVLELVRELGVSTVRYPGGNFVSAYRWEDGVGPRAQRPARLDPAWHSVESNQVGIDEFARWARAAEVELMLAVNLGTRGVREALDLLEYVNHPRGTTLADQRVANGSPDPHGVRMWCLGNEMDGPWQVGHMDAESYGRLAARTAAAMRMLDSDLELVACGSSSAAMPTFGDWERTVLAHCYPHVDYVSCHAYYQQRDGDVGSFLASAVQLERFLEAVAAAVDDVGRGRGESRTISLSLDEWNVWDIDEFGGPEPGSRDWPSAPRLLEQIYTVADAVVVGGLLIAILKHSDRVRAACLAQLVNVIAPIMTVPGGGVWRQTTFFPFSITSRLARGDVLLPAVRCGSLDTPMHGQVAAVDVVATYDRDRGSAAIFVVSRGTSGPCEVTIDLHGLGMTRILESQMLADADLDATNSADAPDRVAMRANPTARLEQGTLGLTLPPASWQVVALAR